MKIRNLVALLMLVVALPISSFGANGNDSQSLASVEKTDKTTKGLHLEPVAPDGVSNEIHEGRLVLLGWELLDAAKESNVEIQIKHIDRAISMGKDMKFNKTSPEAVKAFMQGLGRCRFCLVQQDTAGFRNNWNSMRKIYASIYEMETGESAGTITL